MKLSILLLVSFLFIIFSVASILSLEMPAGATSCTDTELIPKPEFPGNITLRYTESTEVWSDFCVFGAEHNIDTSCLVSDYGDNCLAQRAKCLKIGDYWYKTFEYIDCADYGYLRCYNGKCTNENIEANLSFKRYNTATNPDSAMNLKVGSINGEYTSRAYRTIDPKNKVYVADLFVGGTNPFYFGLRKVDIKIEENSPIGSFYPILSPDFNYNHIEDSGEEFFEPNEVYSSNGKNVYSFILGNTHLLLYLVGLRDDFNDTSAFKISVLNATILEGPTGIRPPTDLRSAEIFVYIRKLGSNSTNNATTIINNPPAYLTCAEMGGVICGVNKTCPGQWINDVRDSASCCSTQCIDDVSCLTGECTGSKSASSSKVSGEKCISNVSCTKTPAKCSKGENQTWSCIDINGCESPREEIIPCISYNKSYKWIYILAGILGALIGYFFMKSLLSPKKKSVKNK